MAASSCAVLHRATIFFSLFLVTLFHVIFATNSGGERGTTTISEPPVADKFREEINEILKVLNDAERKLLEEIRAALFLDQNQKVNGGIFDLIKNDNFKLLFNEMKSEGQVAPNLRRFIQSISSADGEKGVIESGQFARLWAAEIRKQNVSNWKELSFVKAWEKFVLFKRAAASAFGQPKWSFTWVDQVKLLYGLFFASIRHRAQEQIDNVLGDLKQLSSLAGKKVAKRVCEIGLSGLIQIEQIANSIVQNYKSHSLALFKGEQQRECLGETIGEFDKRERSGGFPDSLIEFYKHLEEKEDIGNERHRQKQQRQATLIPMKTSNPLKVG